jgi:hypothetical protein
MIGIFYWFYFYFYLFYSFMYLFIFISHGFSNLLMVFSKLHMVLNLHLFRNYMGKLLLPLGITIT